MRLWWRKGDAKTHHSTPFLWINKSECALPNSKTLELRNISRMWTKRSVNVRSNTLNFKVSWFVLNCNRRGYRSSVSRRSAILNYLLFNTILRYPDYLRPSPRSPEQGRRARWGMQSYTGAPSSSRQPTASTNWESAVRWGWWGWGYTFQHPRDKATIS